MCMLCLVLLVFESALLQNEQDFQRVMYSAHFVDQWMWLQVAVHLQKWVAESQFQILSFSSLVVQGNTTLRPEHWFSSSLIQGHPGHTRTVPNDGFLQVHLTVFIVKIANSYLIATYILKCFGYLFHSPYKSVITEIVRRRGEKSFAFFKIWSVIDLNLVHSHIADPGSENRSEARKYHVISLGAPNGHLSKQIQMQSMVFFWGANSLVISVVIAVWEDKTEVLQSFLSRSIQVRKLVY